MAKRWMLISIHFINFGVALVKQHLKPMGDCVTKKDICYIIVIVLLYMHVKNARNVHHDLTEPWPLPMGNDFILLSDNSGNIKRYNMGALTNEINGRADKARNEANVYTNQKHGEAVNRTNSQHTAAKEYAEARADWWGKWGRDQGKLQAIEYTNSLNCVRKGKPVALHLQEGNRQIGGGHDNQVKHWDYNGGANWNTFYIR